MFYYKITAFLANEAESDCNTNERESRTEINRRAEEIRTGTEAFFEKNRHFYLFVSSLLDRKCYLGAICKSPVKRANIQRYLESISIAFSDFCLDEVKWYHMDNMLHNATRNHFIENDEDILEWYSLSNLSGRYSNYYDEYICEKRLAKAFVKRECENLLSSSLQEETERILSAKAPKNFVGHPVQYMIETDDKEVFERMVNVLIGCLLHAKRIQSKRYSLFLNQEIMNGSTRILRTLYNSSESGTVCVRVGVDLQDDSEFSDSSREMLEAAVECINKHQNSVLSILWLPKACNKIKTILFEKCTDCTFVALSQDTVFADRAKNYLANKAKERHLTYDEKLFEAIADSQKGVSPSELNSMFERWLNNHLKTEVYPQYSALSCVGKELISKKASGTAYEELQEMVGLQHAKTVIQEAVDYFKIQKMFKEQKLISQCPSMHMVFTGSPGTAKTTVARLFAQIMKDNGILSEGRLYEVGRADLVGKYVGWTAQLVKQKFEQAKGSVLFIDEAYSLLDDRGGMYGDEAINTIVQEMENHREDTVVIFAGYSKEMEDFIDRNPGLRSRIAYRIAFEDYNAEELYAIAELIAEKRGVTLSDGVKRKLLSILESAAEQANFGNGRYVRNLLEKAGMKQASRLVHTDYDALTKDMLTTLLPEDFELQASASKVQKKTIGFI